MYEMLLGVLLPYNCYQQHIQIFAFCILFYSLPNENSFVYIILLVDFLTSCVGDKNND